MPIDGALGYGQPPLQKFGRRWAGIERADSWATDAHKTLNVPYDNGLAIVAEPEAMYARLGIHAAYLIQDERPDPVAAVPETPGGPGFTVWAALRSLGPDRGRRDGRGFCRRAPPFAAALNEIDGVRSSTRWSSPRCGLVRPDEVTREVAARLLAEGTAWMTPSTWHGRGVLRISVSNWRTDEDDVNRTLGR